MEKKTKIKMKFRCSEDWDQMSITSNGRFCDQCQHEVLDLTSRSIAEINVLKTGKTKMCGMFLPEQVDEDLIGPIEFKGVRMMKYAATMITFLGLELSTAKGQDKKEIRIEKTDDTGITTDKRGDAVCIEKEEKEVISVKPYKRAKPFLRTDRNSWYWSKRFPFVKKRSNRRLLGAMSF